MLNRIGDFAHSTRMTDLLMAAQTRSRAAQVQISSGKVADRFEGIAMESDRLVGTKSVLQRTQQYQDNNDLVNGRLVAMESSIASLHEVGSQLRVRLLQRLNDAGSVPGLLTGEARAMLDQTVADLNAEFDGRYLFAGSKTDTAPVVLDPAFATFGAPDDTFYQGDAVELTVLADDDIEVTYGMTADRAGFHELVGALRAVIEADAIDDRPRLEAALDLVNAALPKLAEDRSTLGLRQARLDQINIGHSDAAVYLGGQISDIENVDLAEAVTRMTQDQILLESAMATISRLSQLSLADFLR